MMKTGHLFGLAILDGTDHWVRRTEPGGGGVTDSESQWESLETKRDWEGHDSRAEASERE